MMRLLSEAADFGLYVLFASALGFFAVWILLYWYEAGRRAAVREEEECLRAIDADEGRPVRRGYDTEAEVGLFMRRVAMRLGICGALGSEIFVLPWIRWGWHALAGLAAVAVWVWLGWKEIFPPAPPGDEW